MAVPEGRKCQSFEGVDSVCGASQQPGFALGQSQAAAVTTYFAPAGRDEPEQLRGKREILRQTPLLAAALDAMPQLVLVLNEKRQVVAANRIALDLLGRAAEEACGRRPGELLSCIHAPEGPDGCGTSLHCMTCGAVEAILASLSEEATVTRECHIASGGRSCTYRIDAPNSDRKAAVSGE